MMLKKTGLFMGALALAAGGTFAAAGSASATTVTTDEDVSTGTVATSSVRITGTLPSCANYDHAGQLAWVDNNCTYTIHAKILWAFASDTACYTLDPGETLTSSRSGLARFDGAVSC